MEERSKIILQGGVSRECLVLLLDIVARHDPHEAHTHLLQVAADDSTISVQVPTGITAQPAS